MSTPTATELVVVRGLARHCAAVRRVSSCSVLDDVFPRHIDIARPRKQMRRVVLSRRYSV